MERKLKGISDKEERNVGGRGRKRRYPSERLIGRRRRWRMVAEWREGPVAPL